MGLTSTRVSLELGGEGGSPGVGDVVPEEVWLRHQWPVQRNGLWAAVAVAVTGELS